MRCRSISQCFKMYLVCNAPSIKCPFNSHSPALHDQWRSQGSKSGHDTVCKKGPCLALPGNSITTVSAYTNDEMDENNSLPALAKQVCIFSCLLLDMSILVLVPGNLNLRHIFVKQIFCVSNAGGRPEVAN